MRKPRHRREDTPRACRTTGHDWVSGCWTGRANHNWDAVSYTSHTHEVRSFRCVRKCGASKTEFDNWPTELTREEKVLAKHGMYSSMRATMWLMDNVQPAYSSDGSGYEQTDERY